MADEIVKPEADLGKAIFSEAQKRYDEQRRESVLKDVTQLMQHRDESLTQMRHYTAAADWYSRKLTALKAGEFDFDGVTGRMKMHDPDLQRANY